LDPCLADVKGTCWHIIGKHSEYANTYVFLVSNPLLVKTKCLLPGKFRTSLWPNRTHAHMHTHT